MSFTAGQKLAASDLDQLVTQDPGGGQSTATITYTGSVIDVTGTSTTFTTKYANTPYMLWAVFDVMAGSSALGAIFVGTAVVDGTTLTVGEAHMSAATGTRATVAQMWLGSFAAAGSHTIKLQGAGNTYQTFSTHTKWHALVFGP